MLLFFCQNCQTWQCRLETDEVSKLTGETESQEDEIITNTYDTQIKLKPINTDPTIVNLCADCMMCGLSKLKI